MSDPNVTSLFLTLTEPTTVKANYRLEKSQETVPVTTANKLQYCYAGRYWLDMVDALLVCVVQWGPLFIDAAIQLRRKSWLLKHILNILAKGHRMH